jgi:hypothetical protein
MISELSPLWGQYPFPGKHMSQLLDLGTVLAPGWLQRSNKKIKNAFSDSIVFPGIKVHSR